MYGIHDLINSVLTEYHILGAVAWKVLSRFSASSELRQSCLQTQLEISLAALFGLSLIHQGFIEDYPWSSQETTGPPSNEKMLEVGKRYH